MRQSCDKEQQLHYKLTLLEDDAVFGVEGYDTVEFFDDLFDF